MNQYQQHIERQLHQFKVRFILKRLAEGLFVFFLTILILWLVISGLEAIGWFGTTVRALLFYTLAGLTLVLFVWHIGWPLYQLSRSDRVIDDETAARQIGYRLPIVGDKLLNYIQLRLLAHNDLAQASLNQRARLLAGQPLSRAVTFEREKKHFTHYLLPVLFFIALAIWLWPDKLIDSTTRVIHYNEQYTPVAPFHFQIDDKLLAFRNEDYTLSVQLTGEAIPQDAWFVAQGKRLPMQQAGVGRFSITFKNITTSRSFYIEAGGYRSAVHQLQVVDRPALNSLTVHLQYPSYLKKPASTLQNTGSFEVPEGTQARWQLTARFTDSLLVWFKPGNDTLQLAGRNDVFAFSRTLHEDQEYQLRLYNRWAQQQGKLQYQIKIIPDLAPEISVQVYPDTVLYRFVALAGNLADDHGLLRLQLFYRKNDRPKQRITLPLNQGTVSQSFFYQWALDTLNLQPGDQLDFYLQVTDNDAVNHYKNTNSQHFYLRIPDLEAAQAKLEKSRSTVNNQMDKAARQARELKKELDRLANDLKGKKELTWQDKQRLQQLIERKENLSKEIEELQQKNRLLNEQQKQLEEPPPELAEKQQQVQEMLDNMLDEETRELYEELQKLLEEMENTDAVQNTLKQLQRKEINLEQEMQRAVEFLKELQLSYKLQENEEKLAELQQQQEELLKETMNKKAPADSLAAEQEKLQQKFEEFQQDMRTAEKMNQNLQRPKPMPSTAGDEEEIKKQQQQAKEELNKNNRKKSISHQQQAKEQMQKLGQKLQDMQSSMEMQQMQEDLANLQSILNNLLELSFDQEDVLKKFKQIKPSDPQFIKLSQEQLKIKEDARIVNDSLLALAGRVMAISSFVTRELNAMNEHLEASIEAIRERKTPRAVVNQQLAMTSMNNLALMLDNVMQQMQEAMAGMGAGQPKDQSQPQPGLSERQKQLNQQIRELAESGKSGRELSEELAKLAAEQARIRKALEEAAKKYGGKPGQTQQLMQQMEQTEIDLVNKRLTRQTMQRQKQIETRLLEAEKAMRQQELDMQREAKSAHQYEKVLPRAFEEYMRQRAREVELLKTVPPRLSPFFKEEVNHYFERLKKQNNITNN